MRKVTSTFILFTILAVSCKKEIIPEEIIVLVDHGSFEQEGNFTTDGWITNNVTSNTTTPTNGGVFSLQINPANSPDEGYADFELTGIEGLKKYKLTAQINSFDNWPGSISLLKVTSGGIKTVLETQSSDENSWVLKTLNCNTTFLAGDKLVIHLSAGSTESAVPSKYILFDLIELTEQ